jgi:thymidylate synthase (FAD)
MVQLKPIKAKDLLELDKNLKCEVLDCYKIPEKVIWQAGKNDYSEEPIHNLTNMPSQEEMGKWIVDRLLSNDKGHWGPLEHPHITFSVSGFVHNVAMQARTHRIGVSFDIQSQRYTGKRVNKSILGEKSLEEVFYVRPPGFYTDRKGLKYEWTKDDYDKAYHIIYITGRYYNDLYQRGVCEEQARDYLAQAIRQNFVVTFNLRSVLHFMDLRSKMDAQLEIQALCELLWSKIYEWCPSVCDYYKEKRLYKARLSP